MKEIKKIDLRDLTDSQLKLTVSEFFQINNDEKEDTIKALENANFIEQNRNSYFKIINKYGVLIGKCHILPNRQLVSIEGYAFYHSENFKASYHKVSAFICNLAISTITTLSDCEYQEIAKYYGNNILKLNILKNKLWNDCQNNKTLKILEPYEILAPKKEIIFSFKPTKKFIEKNNNVLLSEIYNKAIKKYNNLLNQYNKSIEEIKNWIGEYFVSNDAIGVINNIRENNGYAKTIGSFIDICNTSAVYRENQTIYFDVYKITLDDYNTFMLYFNNIKELFSKLTNTNDIIF